MEDSVFQDFQFQDADLNNRSINIPREEYNYQVIQGWQCPRCKKINAPTLMQCFCNAYQPYIPFNDPFKPYCDKRSGDIIC